MSAARGRACPLCDAPPRNPVGPVYEGKSGVLWRRRSFEERLYRCAEGHI